jgi:purine-binding chemotaxis protein CheW
MSTTDKNENQEILQLVSFNLGNEEFGIDILKVQEIIRMLQITHVPNSPQFVDGVINLRGKVIPVIDLRVKIGMNKKGHTATTRVIVVELSGKTTGFIVDSVSEVLRIPNNIIEAPPSIIVSGIDSDFITGVCKLEDRLLILLDLEKILSVRESAELKMAI